MNPLDYWNAIGPGKPFSVPLDLDRIGQLVDRGAHIVDIGCGWGRVLTALEAHGYTHLTGVDPAPAMIDAARVRAPEATLILMPDPGAIPLPDESADAAFVVGVLTAVPADDDQRRLMREASRVLRPGGVICVADFWIQDDPRNRERYAQSSHGVYGVFDLPEGVTLRHHSREWIAELTAAFDRVALDDITLTTMNGHEARGFQWYGRRPSG